MLGELLASQFSVTLWVTTALIVRLRVAVPVPVLFLADRPTEDVPDAVGVPEITPVDVLIDKPEGRPVAPKLVGELVAVI